MLQVWWARHQHIKTRERRLDSKGGCFKETGKPSVVHMHQNTATVETEGTAHFTHTRRDSGSPSRGLGPIRSHSHTCMVLV